MPKSKLEEVASTVEGWFKPKKKKEEPKDSDESAAKRAEKSIKKAFHMEDEKKK